MLDTIILQPLGLPLAVAGVDTVTGDRGLSLESAIAASSPIRGSGRRYMPMGNASWSATFTASRIHEDKSVAWAYLVDTFRVLAAAWQAKIVWAEGEPPSLRLEWEFHAQSLVKHVYVFAVVNPIAARQRGRSTAITYNVAAAGLAEN